MCAGLVVTGKFRVLPPRDQPWLAGLGFCLFSMNFISFYIAADYLPSGLLSVIFATAAIFGALNTWLFTKRPLECKILLAAAMGVTGLALLLGPEVSRGEVSAPWWAIALPFAGTYLFTIGNLISARLSQTHSLTNIVGQGMVYGALVAILLTLVSGHAFVVPNNPVYWAGVVFLALISSLLAFMTYLTLVNREGAARASYATVLFPIVAMIVSTWAEGYVWTIASVLGLGLALGGTVLIFARRAS